METASPTSYCSAPCGQARILNGLREQYPAVNQGSATPGGGIAFLHILQAAATDRYTIVVEGSATGAFGGEQATLATFTLDGAALGSEQQSIAGPIPQYVRWKATRSGAAGDTVRIALNLVRF